MKTFLFVLAIAGALLWGYNIGQLKPRVYTEKHVMEAICSHSYEVISGEWEDACGLAQAVSGERFEVKTKHRQELADIRSQQ